MDSDSNIDRQENERAVLKAIYLEQMIEIYPKRALWTPLECILTLQSPRVTPAEDQTVPALDLHIICSNEYPLEPPSISIDYWKNVSNQDVKELHCELLKLAEKLKGEVMIFELAQHAKIFLDDCVKPGGYKSFYEEMISRNRDQQEKEMQRKQEADEKKKQEVLSEIHTKEQALKKALRRRQNSVKSIDENPCDTSPKRSETVEEPKNFDSEDRKDKKEEYNPWSVSTKGHSRFENEFEHLNWLGKGAYGYVIKVRNKLDDGLYAIKRIALNPSEKLLNKKITREVKLLSRLNHENVVRYYNSWIESADLKSSPEKRAESPVRKKLNDLALDMLPHNDQDLEWTIDETTASSDECSEDWVMFRSASGDTRGEEQEVEKIDTSSETIGESSSVIMPLLFLYIQMELCDKSTLRLAIDDGLFSDSDRVWRLFREIVEGLCHIHQHGIIHRDLKPVNIFIGQDDHVKIGDFGLATTIVLQKQTVKESGIAQSSQSESSQNTDVSQTGQVGTALYVAPELNKSPQGSTSVYTQKVDIYSLGIIFFEMCHPPMLTSMERMQVLTELRNPEPIFSKDFPADENSSQRLLIRWMLQYDVEDRPTSKDLLDSSLIPPPKLEEREVLGMIRRTLCNPQSRNYKYLISSCFGQKFQPSLDATYNMSSWRSTAFTSSLEIVANKLRLVFHNHGAVSFLPPLLTPAGQVVDSCVCLLTRFGSVVYATHDLQMPFARYLAHNPNVSQLKRYAIDKVYKERPAGVHPKENYECAFDIVTPTQGDLMPEYELLCVIWEILTEFPSILRKSCAIYLNHSNFISAMLSQAGIDELRYKEERKHLFMKNVFHLSKDELEVYLKSIGLPERCYTTLTQWMEIEGPLSIVSSSILSMLFEEEHISACKTALLQIEKILQYCELIGITCPVTVNLGQIRNAHHYQGLMIQIVCNLKTRSKPNELTVVLSGGRYDKLVQQLKELFSRDDLKVNQYVAGFTLSVDKFVFSMEANEKPSNIEVLVCALGKMSVSHDKLILLRDLWKSGVKTSFINTMETLEDVMQRCKEMNIPVIILLKETEKGIFKIRTLSKDRYYEKKLPYSELLDHIFKTKHALMESSTSMKTELKSQFSSDGPSITFISTEKLVPGVKRRYESQILHNLSALLQKFSSKVKIEIFALTIEGEVLKNIESANEQDNSPVMKKYPRHKKCLQKLFDYLEETRKASQSTIIIYSVQDNTYKVLL